MAEKYYLDTSIWMDYYEDRQDPSKDIGEFAFKLLCKLLASNSKIVVSSFLLRELEVTYSLDQIRGLALPFEKLMERVDVLDEQREEAKKISVGEIQFILVKSNILVTNQPGSHSDDS